MKDFKNVSKPRFPYGPQHDFFRSVFSLIGIPVLGGEPSDQIDIIEKRGFLAANDGWIGSVPVTSESGTPADHLEALLTLIVPCDAQAEPIPELCLGDRCFRSNPSDSEEFAFIFPVPPVPENADEFETAVLSILLDYVWLGSRARVPITHQIDPPNLGTRVSRRIKKREIQPLHGVAQSEPFIVALGRYLAAFLANHVLRDANGAPVLVPFFQLRDARHWIAKTQQVPSANEVLSYLSRICNIACEFCYLFGNPATISIARGAKTISKPAMNLRIKLFDPENRQQLFKAIWEINEVLVDPKFEQVARELRARSDETFFFITNGNPLTPARCALLEELKPVELIISTNTIDFRNRSELMHEKDTLTNVALGCFEDLDARQICYGISMVAMPDQSFDDLEETIRALDMRKPAFIRLNLVGYTRDHPSAIEFDRDMFWGKTVRWVQALRCEVKTPIIVIPSAYEENMFYDRPNAARIIGTVPGSPAAQTDLRPYDEIVSVGGVKTSNRAQVQGLLALIEDPTPLRVLRDGAECEVVINPTVQTEHPFVGDLITKYFVPKGVVLAPALSTTDFREIQTVIKRDKIKSAAILTSPLMRPAVEDLLCQIDFSGAEVHLISVENDFLGGNICVLDMATVTDMSASVRRNIPNVPLDHVFVPASSFNELGRDISGLHWHDLERCLGVPVTVLDHTTRFAF